MSDRILKYRNPFARASRGILLVALALTVGCTTTEDVVIERGGHDHDHDHNHAGHARAADAGPADPSRVVITVDPVNNPWTGLDLNNDPDNFQFAVVTDRTGGHRPGVFLDAVHKLNLIQPEFVMSVGDLIEGYTEDQAQLDAEWAEFNGFVEQLEMPFFYVPGNHDISNQTMYEDWNRRFGRSWFHFVYRDVLFLGLNSEDPPKDHMSEEQIDYFRKALAENKDVRWTMVFLHKPLWDQAADSNWPKFEELLKGRRHTVLAGHRHRYVKHTRNDESYIVLATTGGGSGLRGRAFGEFDHVAWVTMTDDGPRIANIMLDGIWDENLRTKEMSDRIQGALAGRAVRGGPFFEKDGIEPSAAFTSRVEQLRLTNDADLPMKITIRHLSTDQVHVRPAFLDMTLEPNSVELVDVRFDVISPVAVERLAPLRAEYEIIYEIPDVKPMVIRSTHEWLVFPPEEKKK